MRSPNTRYNPAIDQLRAFAALLIVYYHGHEFVLPAFTHQDYEWPITANPLYAFLVEGHTAVGMFMVLSAFIFTSSAIGRGIIYRAFMLNRFLRIYPLMLAILGMAIALHPETFRVFEFLRSLVIFLQLPGRLDFGPMLQIEPWTAIFWTITPEFQFYFIFPILMLILNKAGARPIIGLLLAALAAKLVVAFSLHEITGLTYWTLVGRIDQFLIGMLAAYWWNCMPVGRNTWKLFPIACAAVLIGLFIFNRMGGWHAEVPWRAAWPSAEGALWAFFIITYLAIADRVPMAIAATLAVIGEASYSMYLLHWPILSGLHRLAETAFFGSPLARLGLGPVSATLIVITFVLAPVVIAVSMVTYHLIERPFLTMRVRYLRDPLPMAAADLPSGSA